MREHLGLAFQSGLKAEKPWQKELFRLERAGEFGTAVLILRLLVDN